MTASPAVTKNHSLPNLSMSPAYSIFCTSRAPGFAIASCITLIHVSLSISHLMCIMQNHVISIIHSHDYMMPTWERGVVYLDLPVVEIGEEVFQRVDACCVDVCHGYKLYEFCFIFHSKSTQCCIEKRRGLSHEKSTTRNCIGTGLISLIIFSVSSSTHLKILELIQCN